MKANSQRIHNKNLKNLCGQPLFYYIADTLKLINNIKLLVINTDSKAIADFAKNRYGDWVRIHERPPKLQGDKISMNRIIDYDVKKLGLDNIFLQTHSTNPLLSKETLTNAIKQFNRHFAKDNEVSLFSANSLKSRLYDVNLRPINHDPSNLMRTQDLEVVYEDNSCFYLFGGNGFMKKSNRISDKAYVFPMPRNSLESIDIDDPEDWLLTEQIIITQNKKK